MMAGALAFFLYAYFLLLADAASQIESHASYAIGAGAVAGERYIDLVFGSEIEPP
jgi:hypothetical protein